MRPGLALAAAEGRDVVVLKRTYSPIETASLAPASETEIVSPGAVAAAATAPVTPEPPAQVMTAAYTPTAPAPAAPATRKMAPQPVFTLSALPGMSGDVADPSPEMTADEGPAPAASADERQVWYVAARSVNVRQGPSTDSSVVGRLDNGEAVTVVAMEGADWAHVLIEGDGIDGYVAARFLTATP